MVCPADWQYIIILEMTILSKQWFSVPSTVYQTDDMHEDFIGLWGLEKRLYKVQIFIVHINT